MKLKNLMGAFLALSFAAFAPAAVRADNVAVGDIYSIDLVDNPLYGGRVPTEDSPLKIGEKAVIRVRLLNRNFGTSGSSWRLVLKNDSLAGMESYVLAMMSPDLGLMLGGQPAYATYLDTKEVANPANSYTDFYFEYTVQSGDLAMPAQLMNDQGKPASSQVGADYFLRNSLYWKITSDAGDAVFHFRPAGTLPDAPDVPGEPQNYCVSGIGMGLFVKTIDFDRNYAKEAETPTDEDIWRVFYAGETETTTLPPSIATEGGSAADRDTIMYVWSDDESVVAPRKIDGAEEVTDVIGGEPVKRWVLPVTVAKARSSVSFALKAATNAVGKSAHIRMSSSRNLVIDDFGVLVTNWVERTVEVTDPPEPYMSINFVDPSGNPISAVTALPDYKQYSAAMIVKLNGKAPTKKTTVAIQIKDSAGADVTAKVIPAAEADRRIGISQWSDPVEQPWSDRGIDGKLEVEFNPGETEKTLYVYALDPTTDISKKLVFVPVEPDAVLAALLGGGEFTTEYPGTAKTGSLAVNGVKPEITAPAAGTAITGAMAGEDYSLDVTVASSYRNMQFDSRKWKFWYKSSAFGDNNWHSLTDQTVNNKEDGIITVKIKPMVAGENQALEIYMSDPNSADSQHVKLSISVARAKTAWAELDRPDGEYAESRPDVTAKAKFFISQPSESSEPLYAFLRPLNDDASNCVKSAAMTTATPSIGVLIEPGDTDSKTRTAAIQLLDGRYPTTAAIFEVVICKSLAYDGNDMSYSAGQVFLNVSNVCPRIEGVSIGGTDVKQSGTKVETPIALGIAKNFRVSIGNTEPSRVDLDGVLEADGTDNRYWTQWKFGDGEWGAPICGGTLYGDPNTNVLSHAFAASGDQLVKVRVQDKDMRALGVWSEEFSFTVTVLETPSIVIAPAWEGKLDYRERETGSANSTFNVTLTVPPKFDDFASRLYVDLTVTPLGDASKDVGICELSKTRLEFGSGDVKPKSFNLFDLDGTTESYRRGFRITAKASGADAEGKTWADGELDITIINDEPSILQPAEQSKDGEGKVIARETVSGKEETLAWAIDDVEADTNRMEVSWTTSEGETMTYRQGDPSLSTDTVKYLPDVMTGEHKFFFNSSGDLSITMTVKDKDGGSVSRTFYYTIKAQKQLKLRAHGPAGTMGSSGGFSQHYGAAAGLGAGRVYAGDPDKKHPQTVRDFTQTYYFGEDETSVSAYARGYKADGKADDGNLKPGPDQAIDVNGDMAGEGTTDFYNYSTQHRYGQLGYDSFLYGWACNNTDSTAGSAGNGGNASGSNQGQSQHTVYSFLLNIGATGETELPLPAKQTQQVGTTVVASDSYPIQNWEAVFSRERYVTDNCGDINQDGVPDWAVYTFGMGVVDTSTYKLITTETATGSGTVDKLQEGDLTDLKDWNKDVDKDGADDPDYLPATATAAYSSIIPGLKGTWVASGVEFGAKLEIRGYGDGLNDALEQLGATDITSDRVYVDPDTDSKLFPTSTLSKVEYLAWIEYAAKEELDPADPANWSRWSPERPTKPTRSDTDGDKLPDGYEYYFWYAAHVGYMENGVHRYLTGRAYDPRNPGEGRFIDSATIARMMDPRSDLNPVDFPDGFVDDVSNAQTRDTDNDGLPDLLEFELGTNPFDFDTDGDGLPDGYEVAVSYTDPLVGDDTMSNYDGDAMAFTTPALEQNGSVQPKPLHTDPLFTFALVDATGDTDGIQWYVGKSAPTNIAAVADELAGTSFTVGGRTYVTSGKVPVVTNVTVDVMGSVTNLILAADLPKKNTWSTTNAAPEGVEVAAGLIALMPTRIPAGTAVADISETTYAALGFTADVKDVNAAWVYGRRMGLVEVTDVGATPHLGFGMLAIGRYQDAKCTDVAGRKVWIAALPAKDDSVAYVHHLVYQEFGFDPRTAWRAKTPLAQRWGKTVTTGEGDTQTTVSIDGVASGFAGTATRTRAYSRYDEFLVMSFFLNNGMLAGADVTPTQAMPWREIWKKYTTNGRGPYEPYYAYSNDESEDTEKEESEDADAGKSDEDQATLENGADTDGDGVPDGWELYVMAGPKDARTGKYVFVSPLAVFGPFRDCDWAADAGATDSSAGDNDGLTELQEFAGTDSCAHYAGKFQISPDKEKKPYAYSTTILRPLEHKYWLNKFFPTDPWEQDTDGDGLSDNATIGNSAKFLYGKDKDLVDTGKTCIPGGGLNPCSVDTDMDGLPDPWEVQFHGDHVYLGEDRQMATGIDIDHLPALAGDDGKTTVSHESSDIPLQGFCDGMDATVFDAYTTPRIVTSGSEGATTDYLVVRDGVNQVVDRDYDKDGLENWQEYLTGAMRCWRYDDPATGWGFIPDELYWFKNPLTGEYSFAPDLRALGVSSDAEFWYRTLFDRKSPIYNPHLVTGTSPSSQYFSRVKNGWDPAFTENGSYYMFYDRVNDVMIMDSWGYMAAPSKYICTSPIVADTDKDGMDDGYELFHGMNPILGASGVLQSSDGPCDIVYDAWYKLPAGSPVSALDNPWMKEIAGNGAYDFVAHPWLNGLVDADPDGDDIRNQDEAIMPLVAPQTTWYHTDPTPLWMTDSSYSDSLVNRFFRLPIALGAVSVPASIWYDADGDGEKEEIFLRDCDGYRVLPLIGPVIEPFTPDFWRLSVVDAPNWMFSFEENEGYDTDHDSTDDNEELKSKFRAATDPQDADSPRRRQAMYFPGKDAALQSMPFVHEGYPRAAMGYPDDMSFLQYTVECWVRPEAGPNGKVADATVLERTSFVDPSHCMDERYVRRNFAIQIKNGKWCTAFDSNGTLDKSVVEVVGATDVKADEWTHVAATYDATRLTLYVNGNEDGYVPSSLKPEYGASAVVVYPAGSGASKTNQLSEGSTGSLEALRGTAHAYWFDREYSLHAFLIGASFAQAADSKPLDLTQAAGWKNYYTSFFRGYVDEIRVWDGARSVDDIVADMKKRYTREDALENRNAFYKQWVRGEQRYNVGDSGEDIVPELRFHWAFDSIPGAENAAAVAQAPHGFLETAKARYSRPADYVIPWWAGILGAYGSVYAGEGNWVPWIPNTVTHLPRYDSTTLDSYYWSEDHAGDKPGVYKFARTAEPVSKWTQYVRNQTERSSEFRTTGRRFWLSHNTGTNATSTLDRQFEFTGRHLNQTGDDLIPLGGAFARYVSEMWDEQGASSMWEQTGEDADNDGLPDWWQEYFAQNFREDVPEGVDLTWDTPVWYEVGGVRMQITAGEAYHRDLAKGVYVDGNGEVRTGPTEYAQTAKSDGMIPDWWKELKKIDREEPLFDTDNDGLNNYVEYVASELLPFRLNFDPRMAKSDTKTLDYFRRVGKLYVGEMLTDHDQMEDHWERSLGDESVASAALWDALKDGEEDGWVNFAENRYNGYSMSTLAQLIAHAMGDEEVLDAPIPSLKMKVRYNGDRPLDSGEAGALPPIVVHAYSKNAETGDYVMNPDATWTVKPGEETEERSFYLGAWEDRIVRGTLAPGNVNLDSVDIKFAQVPQNDLYSWTDESGPHLAKSYKEFKEAFDKNPNIIQNIQSFQWLSLVAPANEYTSSDKAVTVTRDEKGQDNARFAVYGEPVGTINLSTGDFEFDLGAMNRLRVNYTFDSSKGSAAAWSYKEAIFKITYTAKVPSAQQKIIDFSLAKADKGFVRGGLNSIEVFYDSVNANGTWDPGEPFGVLNDVEIGWAGCELELELTDMSAVTPRVKLWGTGGEGGQTPSGGKEGQTGGRATAADSDRGVRVGTATFEAGDDARFEVGKAPASKSRVRVVRYKVDNYPVYRVGVDAGVVLEKDFEETARDFLHEGDFLADGDLDIDWKSLYTDVVDWWGVQAAACEVTNVTYLVVYNWDADSYRDDDDSNTLVRANATLVTRRFEVTRSVPTPVRQESNVTVFNTSRPTFTWKIVGEDKWASWFGTTYTAFKVCVKDLKGNLVYDSGVRRLPAKDSLGQYNWTAPLYVGEVVPETGVLFANLANYTWEVAVYNAKFSTDDLMTIQDNELVLGNPFSEPTTFRMNVTDKNENYRALAARVCYVGPATWLADRVRVQAFTSPDFTGDPAAEITLGDVSAEALSPADKTANATLIGLPEGSYFLRAYIDTNTNGVHDAWESWGYLNERDQASKPGIFNPVAAKATFNPAESNVRTILIEDCDTDGDWFPDVWEAEQNKGVFDPEVIKPVTGNAELIGVNTNLDAKLTKAMQGLGMLASADGFALLTGFNPAQVRTTVAANGATRFSVDNKVDSVTISKLEFDADGNVVISLDAKTSTGAVDPAAAAIYDLDLSKTVTCRIYRKMDLASSGWGEPVAEETVTVGAGPVTIEIAGEKTAQAYYKAEIVEK